MQEIFSLDSVVAVTDPVYPVYVDTNVMAGRTGPADSEGRYQRLVYLPTTAANGFDPPLPEDRVDLVYLCAPNNPTGAVMSRASLARWVAWAKQHEAIILFDAAYEAFVRDPSLPRSIFEIPGAREVALEFRSFSKTAGFTGTRCAFTVIPKELKARDDSARGRAARPVEPPPHHEIQRGQLPHPAGRRRGLQPRGAAGAQANIDYTMENARLIREGLGQAGYRVFGGVNAPYIWMQVPAA